MSSWNGGNEEDGSSNSNGTSFVGRKRRNIINADGISNTIDVGEDENDDEKKEEESNKTNVTMDANDDRTAELASGGETTTSLHSLSSIPDGMDRIKSPMRKRRRLMAHDDDGNDDGCGGQDTKVVNDNDKDVKQVEGSEKRERNEDVDNGEIVPMEGVEVFDIEGKGKNTSIGAREQKTIVCYTHVSSLDERSTSSGEKRGMSSSRDGNSVSLCPSETDPVRAGVSQGSEFAHGPLLGHHIIGNKDRVNQKCLDVRTPLINRDVRGVPGAHALPDRFMTLADRNRPTPHATNDPSPISPEGKWMRPQYISSTEQSSTLERWTSHMNHSNALPSNSPSSVVVAPPPQQQQHCHHDENRTMDEDYQRQHAASYTLHRSSSRKQTKNFWQTISNTLVIFFILGVITRGLFDIVLLITHEGRHHHWYKTQALSFSSLSSSSSLTTTPTFGLKSTILPHFIQIRSRSSTTSPIVSNITLRQFLTHPDGFHLAMAPAFFGYFAYFGALSVWDEELGVLPSFLHHVMDEGNAVTNNHLWDATLITDTKLKSVAGASAGAMAAVLLAAGIKPRRAAEFVSDFTVADFADPFGIGGVLRGDKFEDIMQNYMEEEYSWMIRSKRRRNATTISSDRSLYVPKFNLQDGIVPVAVSGFDLLSLQVKLLSRGSMARAARSSACFPGLFQPVPWWDEKGKEEEDAYLLSTRQGRGKTRTLPDALLIDGGVTDGLGLRGLSVLPGQERRVVNLVVGDFGFQGPAGPSDMPDGLDVTNVVSVSITNTPRCGPWAMANGPRAVESARLAMLAMLDVPMYVGKEDGHYVLNVDASKFVP